MIKSVSRLAGATVAAFAIATGAAQAATVSVIEDGTDVAETTALTGFATEGDAMDGMVITATFADGSSEELIWGTTGAGAGGAFGSLFSLNLTGNTFTADWVLTNLSSSLLTMLSIDAGAGDTVFDIVPVDQITPGSANGRAFEDRSPTLAGDVVATYSLAVALTGNVPLGDLFALLMVDFTGLDDGGVVSQYLFGADTDNLSIAGDLTPVIPVPGAFVLLLTGLAGLGYAKRRNAA